MYNWWKSHKATQNLISFLSWVVKPVYQISKLSFVILTFCVFVYCLFVWLLLQSESITANFIWKLSRYFVTIKTQGLQEILDHRGQLSAGISAP